MLIIIIFFKTPLSDDDLIGAVKSWKENSQIGVVLVGGGHFAGAVFNG